LSSQTDFEKAKFQIKGKSKRVPHSSNSDEQKTLGVSEKKNGDEGFIIVSKMRKNSQKITNGVT